MYGTAEAARADTAVHHIDPSRHPARICLLIDPEDWEWIEGNRDFQAKLAELRIEHEFDFKTSNQGHTWNYFYTIAPKMGRYIAQSFEELSPETPGAVLASFDLQ
ncbi:MAG: hypothetical protein BWZ10_02279 [candidate division BRC1 bacterium ADurb.BinA364]|nr:MAG: hypothetical protein BWZ10_02279 [candidate division BRC1 bacterium ADurb.BinA364]